MNAPLRIVCATSLAGGAEAFQTLGEVEMVAEKDITSAVVRDADILVTRSKVRVDDQLLEGSRLRFYGTATAGYDHVDVAALERRGIAWTQAPGSNANSVAEYVIATLAWLGLQRQVDWTGKTMAIIGAGHVGGRLAVLARAFGLRVLLNDPPRRAATGDERYLPLHEAIRDADIVTLHVPLTDDGPCPTRGMADANFFALMRPGAVLINSSRGEVVSEPAMADAVRSGRFSAVMLDVFDHEPDISIATLCQADLATPHIAGYSLDARLRGTEMVYQAACRHVGVAPVWTLPPGMPAASLPREPIRDVMAMYDFILSAYNPGEDDRRLRSLPVGIRMADHFQDLRRHYPERREFRHVDLSSPGSLPELRRCIELLGFIVHPVPS